MVGKKIGAKERVKLSSTSSFSTEFPFFLLISSGILPLSPCRPRSPIVESRDSMSVPLFLALRREILILMDRFCAQAHFDCLQPPYNLVDGARLKWCIPQILDVLIYFFENDAFKPAVRREFNQQKVLSECLLRELQYRCSGLGQMRLDRVQCSNFIINVHVDKILYPWNHIDSIRTIVVKCPPSKSKKKYVEVVNQLCSKMAEIVANRDLTHVIKTAISRLLCGVDPKSVCMEQPPFTYSPDFDPSIVATLSADRLGELAAMEFSLPATVSTPDGRTSDDSSLKEEGCPIMAQMGAKRRSSSIHSTTSTDGEYILGSFKLNGDNRTLRSPYSPTFRGCSPLQLQIPSATSVDDMTKMYECDSLPDQDMPMDCDGEEEFDGRKSDFDLYVDSIESSEHTASAVMFAASPTYFESPRLSRRLIEGEALNERCYSRRSSSRRSSLNTVGSSTTVDSTGSEFLHAFGPKLASSLGSPTEPYHLRDRIEAGTSPAFSRRSLTSPPPPPPPSSSPSRHSPRYLQSPRSLPTVTSVARMFPSVSP